MVAILRGLVARKHGAGGEGRAMMGLLGRIVIGFFRFWYDFIVGDAWEIAAGVAVVLVARRAGDAARM